MRIKNAKFSIRDRFSSGGKVIEFCKAMHSSFILMFTAKSLKFKPKSYLNGFTMIEMLIALGLFAVVVSVGIGGFAHALRIQRQTQFLLAVNSNGGEILEQMSREIRTGSIFYILPPPTSGLLFRNANIEDVRYYLDGGMIKRGTTDKSAARTLPPDPMDAPTELLPLNSNIVTIDYLIFDLSGTGNNDRYPPRVTIRMGMSPNSSDASLTGVVMRLQTTVSARQADDAPLPSGP